MNLSSHRIVFVEDDEELAELISQFLSQHGFTVDIVPRGDLAEARVLADPPDLVLLDVMLPGKDGLSVCRDLRPRYDGAIVMLTSVSSDMNHILGLELGADDYVIKTTPPNVLLARLRAQLRQRRPGGAEAPAADSKRLVFGQLRIDPDNRDVALAGEPIHLTTSDFDLLWELASHAGEILSRESLFKTLRGLEYDGMDRSMDVAISRLRKKLGDDAAEPRRIKTVRNRGYLFVSTSWD